MGGGVEEGDGGVQDLGERGVGGAVGGEEGGAEGRLEGGVAGEVFEAPCIRIDISFCFQVNAPEGRGELEEHTGKCRRCGFMTCYDCTVSVV